MKEELHPTPDEEEVVVYGEQYADVGIVDISVTGLRPDIEDQEGNVLTPGTINTPEVQSTIINNPHISTILNFIEEKGLNSSWKQKVSVISIAVGVGVILGLERKRGWRDIQELHGIFKKEKDNQV